VFSAAIIGFLAQVGLPYHIVRGVDELSDSGNRMTEKTLDLRGLQCPLPALRARKALSALASGNILVLECTDPLTAIDIPNLVNQTGDTLVERSQADTVLTFRIQKR
jgi:tRNA 2-thiouridine synthesizing protein A